VCMCIGCWRGLYLYVLDRRMDHHPPYTPESINITPEGGECVVQGHIIWDQLYLFDRAKVQRREKKGRVAR
jgi:hypothetical protein